ncbi:MAG: hypothetical protein EXX96DRAFT_646568 [Benjaminiella poitrasii]|nr:MAG: hypothetical protein EXX96DRAFT_646568 [Benjaminiella poitrasii]
MIQELEEKYNVEKLVDLEGIEKFEVEKLRPIYKLAKKDAKKAKKMAHNLIFEEEGDKEQMCQAIINFLNKHDSPLPSHYNEDIFTKKYITPLISPFLGESKCLKLFGNDEESKGSKKRRGSHGRKSDGGLKVVYKEHEQIILHMEIKGPNIMPEDKAHHPDFTKLANLMKDEVDLMLKNSFPEDTPVFGPLIGGRRATVPAMDLVYTRVYRLFEVGSFYIPHSAQDLARLDELIDSMIKLKALTKCSMEKCLKALKMKDSPGSPPRRRHLYVQSFMSPKINK